MLNQVVTANQNSEDEEDVLIEYVDSNGKKQVVTKSELIADRTPETNEHMLSLFKFMVIVFKDMFNELKLEHSYSEKVKSLVSRSAPLLCLTTLKDALEKKFTDEEEAAITKDVDALRKRSETKRVKLIIADNIDSAEKIASSINNIANIEQRNATASNFPHTREYLLSASAAKEFGGKKFAQDLAALAEKRAVATSIAPSSKPGAFSGNRGGPVVLYCVEMTRKPLEETIARARDKVVLQKINKLFKAFVTKKLKEDKIRIFGFDEEPSTTRTKDDFKSKSDKRVQEYMDTFTQIVKVDESM